MQIPARVAMLACGVTRVAFPHATDGRVIFARGLDGPRPMAPDMERRM